MTTTSRKCTAGLLVLGLLAAPAVSFAQGRSAITVRPAVVAAPAAVVATTATPAPLRSSRAVPTAIIPVTPTPLPPLPPNFCFRGNSSGVSRC
jgi:hypothetical protein